MFGATLKFRPLLELARDRGVDVERCLAAFGLSVEQMLDPERRLVRTHGVALTLALCRDIADPLVGLRVAERFSLTDLDRLGYVLLHSESAYAGLEQLVYFSRLIADALTCRMAHEGGCVRLRIGLTPSETLFPESADGFVAILARIVSLLTGGAARPMLVSLERPLPAEPARYREHFGAPVRFDATFGELVYPIEPLLAPLPRRDARLCHLLIEDARRRLAELGQMDPWIDAVRKHIRDSLERDGPRIDAAARELRCSERTLRRRLAEQGTSFRALLDGVRCDRALALLRSGRWNVCEVADALRFADATAFSRSFRRWTGQAPKAFLTAQRQLARTEA